MEQVMAPNWHFRTVKEDKEEFASDARSVTVEGLKPLSSAKTKMIVQEQLDDLKAAILQDEMVVRAISGSTTAERLTKELIPKIIKEKYTDLTDDEVEEVRQRVILDTLFKSGEIVNEKGESISFEPGNEERESEGNKLLKIANRFIEIDKLSINLIDTINPFQRAYEVMSKSIDVPTLRIIQNAIAEQKFNLTIEEAITLFKGPLKQYVQEHNGKIPSADDPNPKVRELAAALQMMKNLKERRMRGLDFNPNEF